MPRRSANFSLKEKNLLLDLIKKYKSVIENKASGAIPLSEKNQAWEFITEEYNCSSLCDDPRDTRQLKLLYKNLKRKTRKNVAEENLKQKDGYMRALLVKEEDDAEIRATEGSCYKPVLDETGAKVLSILHENIKSLENNYDDAAEYFVQNVTPDLHLIQPEPEIIDPVKVASSSGIETCVEPPEPVPATRKPKKFRIDYKHLYLKKKYEVACFELRSKKELHELDVEIRKQQLKQLNQ